MTDNHSAETTLLLRAWAEGNAEALARLVPRVQRELCRLAGHHLRNEHPGNSLQAADLVQELYLKLLDIRRLEWQHRAHFFALSATLMRQILLDRARRKAAAKRGQKPIVVDFKDAVEISTNRSEALVALDDALSALAEIDQRKARVVELRFFGGLEIKEIAAVLRVSPETVMRDWRLARSWLLRELRE
ncbi:MAG: sigma-70 family RNA polymerase sigma factor [Acidobacteriia bacterium]|nr:sigma-70 family RNA polymerase sigma factor [Terriglobia bacterium]